MAEELTNLIRYRRMKLFGHGWIAIGYQKRMYLGKVVKFKQNIENRMVRNVQNFELFDKNS